uniref:glycogen phosphorylase n=1 Tax=Cyanothece sp. (strain PCC 7425 / ATCC 29141) TaxID=395961 RepID=B8HS94_CYAP4
MLQPIRVFNVSPALPERLEPLRRLAYNLYWSWNNEASDLFYRLDRDLWESSRHNPVLLLGTISQQRLLEILNDEGFLAQMDRVSQQFDDYLNEAAWYQKHRGKNTGECYAYFSAEFGLTDCLPIYSGGLGILAGDHLKSASDLGLPLVGVGLLYQRGYFSQYLNADGWQQEQYPINDFYNMPLHLERQADGTELRIKLDFPNRTIQARVWRIDVGRVPLYLLDTNVLENSEYDQNITDYLYGGDIDVRIHQEIMLGIGGVKMLRSLGFRPTVYHMNEGHSAFLSLERIRVLMQEEGLTYAEAKQVTQSSQIFTTHTPVPAGIDLFPPDKVLYYLGGYGEIFGLSRQEFLALGRENTGDFQAPFSMADLAIKMATFVNGVSKLHGEVSRSMFKGLWPKLPLSEIPITSITNGVHARSRVADVIQDMFDRYLGPNWSEAAPEDLLWQRFKAIPDEELWRNHERCRYQLVMFARQRLQRSLRDRGASPAEIEAAGEILDPSALTIGFARRFATYKRATLFLQDLERIRCILLGQIPLKFASNRKPTVQFVIAGKAHPHDNPGKELIRAIVHFAQQSEMREHIVFIPDYDIYVAKLMVSGCDVWLNTPLRPLEASGTSGMKAAMNGLPNLSTLDGWWDEADYVRTGWAIGEGEVYADLNYQNQVESNALYERLEREVIPLFYDRDERGLPRKWVAKMKDCIQLNCPQFNTARMVKDYALQGYFPASDRFRNMTANGYTPAKELAHWKAHLFEHWYNIKVENVDVSSPEDVQVNQPIAVKAGLRLGPITPEDVQALLFQGKLDESGQIIDPVALPMDYHGEDGQGISLYTANVSYSASGRQGLALQVLPNHPNLSSPYEMDLVLWA